MLRLAKRMMGTGKRAKTKIEEKKKIISLRIRCRTFVANMHRTILLTLVLGGVLALRT
jgi:hypothetical protein